MAADALELSMLESKDRDQLFAIASALGVKTTSRAKKADLIQKILEQVGSGDASEPADTAPASASVTAAVPVPARAAATRGTKRAAVAVARAVDEVILGPDGEPLPDWEVELIRQGISTDTTPATEKSATPAPRPVSSGPAAPGAVARRSSAGESGADEARDIEGRDIEGSDIEGSDIEGSDSSGDGEGQGASRRRRRRRNKNRTEFGDRPDGDHLDVARSDAPRENGQRSDALRENGQRNDAPRENGQRNDAQRNDAQRNDAQRNNRNDRFEGGEQQQLEPVSVSGYLDLREEGYGFLRVNGYLASRDDAYIPVKLTRQFGLRKGDFVTGLSRPAGRNEKNPAMLEIHTVNGDDPDKARDRPRFEDLTPLFPDTKLQLENPADPTNVTARIIDLISPIGKGQRGIIVSPPKAGKTTIMKTIATAIERNHPEVTLIVLLIDERPEEVTDMRRTVKGEVIASTFDRPSEEHTHVAELCIEKAKRLVEMGKDVVIILDGITRLSRAYNLAAPATGRVMSGGIDAGALYPPKKFFGAARNVEEGGSLTILATALIETNSRMDDAIFEEFKGTGNMELRLDRRLAERRVYPAIDVDASSTRHEELLFDRNQLQMVWKLRRVLSGLAAEGSAAPGLELLIDRLKTFRTNDEFLKEISKQPAS